MQLVVEKIQQLGDTNLIPIFNPWKQWPTDTMLVPQLSDVLHIQKSQIPNFFVVNPYTRKVIAYPDPLIDHNKFSPMLILHWASITVLNIEIEAYEQEILDFYENNPEGAKT